MPRALLFFLILAVLAAAGCGGGSGSEATKPSVAADGNEPASAPVCPPAWRAGWQRLADRIHAPVYCPSWLPDPLTGEIGGRWNNINSVDPDGSYLVSFIWYETGSGEIHVNFRAYPGRTAIPRCVETVKVKGRLRKSRPPCFADPHGRKRIGGLGVTVYTANRDADAWHILYAWRFGGSLYTVSEHVATPLTYGRVLVNLDRVVGGLAVVRPSAS